MFLLAEISQHKKRTKFVLAVLPFAMFSFCPNLGAKANCCKDYAHRFTWMCSEPMSSRKGPRKSRARKTRRKRRIGQSGLNFASVRICSEPKMCHKHFEDKKSTGAVGFTPNFFMLGFHPPPPPPPPPIFEVFSGPLAGPTGQIWQNSQNCLDLWHFSLP